MKKTIILVSLIIAVLLLIAVAMIPGLDPNGAKTKIVGDELLIIYNDGTVINMGAVQALKSTNGLDFYPLPDGTYGVKMGKAEYLEEITIPSHYKGCAVTRVLTSGFSGAANLKRITIPDTVTIIEMRAFQECKNLEYVNMGNGVTTIGVDAFNGCKALQSVVLSVNLETIDANAFYDCTKLTELRIPDGTERIERDAFNGCYGLKTVVIPISVEFIGKNALSGAYKVDIHYAGTVEQWLKITARQGSSWWTMHYESTP